MVNICFINLIGFCVLTQGVAKAEKNGLSLPKDTKPLFYTLKVQPIINATFNSFVFNGDVTIKILAMASTKKLTLNADDLKINDVKVTNVKTGSIINVRRHHLVIKNQLLKIHLKKPGLTTGLEYNLKIVYSGKLRNDTTGFYRKSYFDKESNTTKWLTATHFNSTYARRAFPCYDEPTFKTPFSISVIRQDTEMSQSIMPRERFYQISHSLSINYICDQYPTTPPIFTHMVQFSVSESTNRYT